MIVNAFLQIIYVIIWAITSPLRLLNDVQTPEFVSEAIQSVDSILEVVSTIAPLDSIAFSLGVVVSFELGYNTYRLIMWALKRLPTQS